MEEILVNLVAKVRREVRGGRTYLVAPATTIIPGVLNGSKGALYYPPDEIARNHTDWNGMPIVVYHPVEGGMHVSARDPLILEKQGVGHLYRTRVTNDGKLGHELWIDEEALQRVDNELPEHIRLLPRLERGMPIELSTGLFTDNEPASAGANYRGRPYQYTARNYRPDHLALLPDQVGACSVNDGCGVLVNRKHCGCGCTVNSDNPQCPT